MSIDTTLSTQHVDALFRACIITPPSAVVYEGEIHGIMYVNQEVEKYWRDIGGMLAQLDPSIQTGATWLNYMMDNAGERWGNPAATTQLIALGMAAMYTHRIQDEILPYENNVHPSYACPCYRTNLQNNYLPAL